MRPTPVVAGATAGCRTILARTGWGENSLEPYRATWANVEPAYVAGDLLDVTNVLLARPT